MSTLSSMLPKSLAENIAFVLTNVSSALSMKSSEDIIPSVLRDVPRFLLDNPVALQKKYLALKGNLGKKKLRAVVRRAVLAGEERALEMLVDLFDWLDGRRPQPTTEVVYLYNLSQNIEAMITDAVAEIDQAATKKAEIDKLIVAPKNNPEVSFSPCSRLGFNLISFDIGHGCFLPLREHHHNGRLEAAAVIHHQYDMRPG